MDKYYDIALKEVPYDEGISRGDVEELLNLLDTSDGIAPLYISGDTSYAMGFCTNKAFSVYEDSVYEGNPVAQNVQNILCDMGLENEDDSYLISGLNVYLSR